MIWSPGTTVRLETPRLCLRSLSPDDVGEAYLAWLRDPEVMRFVNARFAAHDLESTRSFVATHDNTHSFLLGIRDRESDAHIGNYEAVVDQHHEHAHIGVLIGERAWWGRGVVAEAQTALLDFLFERLDLIKVCGRCYGSNRAALFNYQSQGFENEGVLRSHVVLGDGRDDVILFAMTKDAWIARWEARA